VRLRPSLCTAGLMAVLASCAGSEHPFGFQNNDLLAIGRLDPANDGVVLDDLGLNVQFTARFRIKHLSRGKAPSSVLTVYYIAHTSIPGGKNVRLHLRRHSGGEWLVCSGGGRGYVC
jgi:hypothetical protein